MTVTETLIEELRWTGAAATAARVRAGELTPRQTVEAALARIDASQERLNAFRVVLHAAALAEAEQVAQRLAAGEHLPLAGVPIAVKDDMPFAGQVCTKSSRTLTQVATEDAEIVRLLRAAGAIPVGLTRTPEYCLFPYSESALGGITRNPWDPSRTPGGSSGGSAAAVAAGLVPLATGGDGGGSLREPGAWTGIPALFATPGSVSIAPIEHDWFGMASMGALARSIADTALAYDVLFTQPQDLAGAVAEPPPAVRIGTSLDRAINQPIPQAGAVDPARARAMDLTASLLERLGHSVAPTRLRFGNTSTKFAIRFLNAAADDLAHADEPQLAEPVTKLAARLGRLAKPLLPWALRDAKERALVERSLEGVDVLLTPTVPCAAPPAGERDGKPAIVTLLQAPKRVAFCNAWNLFGWPGLSVPVGLDADGLPLAILLTARPGQERLLLQLGAQLEAEQPWPLGPGAPA